MKFLSQGQKFEKIYFLATTQNTKNNDMDDLLPPCPADMQGPISFQRMVDPVVASDGFTYERSKIEEWLGTGKRTSPMTRKQMNTTLNPNQGLKTRIQEWVEENTGLNGLEKQLKQLQGPVLMASTPKEALDAIVMIGELVTRSKLSNLCILGRNGVQRMRLLIDTSGNLSDEVTNALDTLEQQCVANVFELREEHTKVLQQRTELKKAKEATKFCWTKFSLDDPFFASSPGQSITIKPTQLRTQLRTDGSRSLW